MFFFMRRGRKRSGAPSQMETVQEEAEELVDSVDRERIAYVKHYFDADWPTRSLYHMMLNTAVGNEPVIQTILNTMQPGRSGWSQELRTYEPARSSRGAATS